MSKQSLQKNIFKTNCNLFTFLHPIFEKFIFAALFAVMVLKDFALRLATTCGSEKQKSQSLNNE